MISPSEIISKTACAISYRKLSFLCLSFFVAYIVFVPGRIHAATLVIVYDDGGVMGVGDASITNLSPGDFTLGAVTNENVSVAWNIAKATICGNCGRGSKLTMHIYLDESFVADRTYGVSGSSPAGSDTFPVSVSGLGSGLHTIKINFDYYSPCIGGSSRAYATDSRDFTISAPIILIPPAPTGLSASCPSPGTTASLHWDAVSGATYYDWRADDTVNGWTANADCTGLQPGDQCKNNYKRADDTFTSIPGDTYNWWVHACNSAGCSAAATGAPFTCPVPLSASCSASSSAITAGGTATWTATASGGSGAYNYSWSDTAGNTGSTGAVNSWSKTYSSAGTVNGSVAVADTGGQTTSTSCGAVTVTAPSCTYTYSDWGACQPDGTQTRTVLSASPPGCTGTPVTSQSCTYSTTPVLSGTDSCSANNLSWTSTVSPDDYFLGKCTGSSCAPSAFSTTNVRKTSYTDTAVTNGTTYSYGVQCRTCGAGGNPGAWSNTVTLTPSCTGGPNLSAFPACSPTRVNLWWTYMPGAFDYVYRCNGGTTYCSLGSLISSRWSVIATTSVGMGTYTDYGAVNNMTYTYEVSDEYKESASNLAEAAPSCGVASSTLSASLSAFPSSGSAPLNAKLTASVSGTATGTINYTFYCNRADAGTNITSPWDVKVDGTTTTSQDATCTYPTAGTYTAKVIAERGTLAAQDRRTITVTAISVPQLPICTFTANPSTITPPAGSDLQWTCKYAKSCSINRGIGSVNPLSGDRMVYPTSTTAYTLACSNPDGKWSGDQTVTVSSGLIIKEIAP